MSGDTVIRVLVIDDSAHDRDLVRHALEVESKGFAVREVTNRQDLEQALAQEDFDVVLSDFNILGFEGLDVIRIVREQSPGTPVIVLTGTGSEEIAVAALKQGADDYIIKTHSHIRRLPESICKVVEQRKIREKLEEREANLRAVTDNIADAVLVVSDDERILYANKVAEKLFRLPAGELDGVNFGYPVTGDKPAEIDLPHRPEGPGVGEMRVARTTFEGNNAWIVSIRDISERKRAEEMLYAAQQEEQLVNRIAELFLTIPDEDMYGQVLAVIQDALQSPIGIFGYMDDEGAWCCPSLSRNVWDQCRMTDKTTRFPKESWPDSWVLAMGEKKSVCSNQPSAVPEGHLPIVRFLDAPIVVGERLVGNIIVANKDSDYTDADRHFLERIAKRIAPVLDARLQRDYERQQKEKAEEQLRHAQRLEAIGRLAGGVAHDFNNILTPIMGYAELMASQLPPDHPHRRRLDVIRRAAERGKDLTRHLLAFGRKQTLKKEALSLNEVVADFEKMLSRTIPESVTIKLELDSENPIVLADRAQLEQVIMNLAVNGADAMPQGGTLTIGTERKQIQGGEIGALEGMATGEFAVLSVSDTGTGIDEDVLEHIFEPFFTTKEKGRGTGLGLSTVFGIVRQHGGDVRVYSEKGKGSTFRVYLPMAEGASIKREQDAGNRLVDSGDLAGTESILVVEDQGEVRELAVTVLEEAGYRVRAAESGEQALEFLETEGSQLDLVLTDVVMTGMSGPDMVVRLREKFPDVRVIYMSGYPRSVLADQDLVSDGADVLSKPFMPSELLVRVRSVLDGETE